MNTYKVLYIFFMISIGSGNNLFSQSRTILVYDLLNETVDSIVDFTYDTTLQKAETLYNIGDFNSDIQFLNDISPTTNLFPDSRFTLKRKAALDFDLNSFPIRTSVKIFYVENDTLKDLCSGSIISEKHVLTAAHCVSNLNRNELSFDSLYICPVYDDSLFSSDFNCSYVSKVYFLKDWSLLNDDLSVLELKEPIGKDTGWLGVGFNNLDSFYLDGVFYKFSYPAGRIFVSGFFNDPTSYNGDTLYYSYGDIDLWQNSIAINGVLASPGESGSSIVKIENNKSYTSYGVASTSVNARHSKINNETFHFIESIIKNDILSSNSETVEYSHSLLYPNPTNDALYVNLLDVDKPAKLNIFDANGRLMLVKLKYHTNDRIDISNLPNGFYYLTILIDGVIEIAKFIKNER